MWRNYDAEWERKKRYLIRSLFDETPPLSPIPEIQTTVESLSPTEIALSRPYSPLPDLIIEKEPNRHDDPKENYEVMERRIMKLYRKLFHDEQSSESSINNDLPSNESKTLSREEDEAVEDESDEDESGKNESVTDTSLSNDSNTDESTTTSDPHYNYVTQAQVHRAGSEVIDIEKVLKSQSSGPASDASTSPDEPETMRRRKTISYDSIVSTHDLNVARYCSEDSPEVSAEISFSREMEEAKLSSPNSIASLGIAPKISSPRKRKIDDGCNWEYIKNKFFIGRARIFKVCSCRNHVCH